MSDDTPRALTGPAASSGGWTPKRLAFATVFTAFLAFQLGVPAAMLFEPRPAKFGWQMFSGTPETLGYGVVLADGTVEDVDPGEHLVTVRLDASLDRVLPDQLCRVTPAARAVLIRRIGGAEEQLPCD